MRAFHHRVINADGRCGGEGSGFKANEIPIARGAGHRGADTLQHLWRMGFKLDQHGRGSGDKHAGIPQIPAGYEEFRSAGGIRLFHKACDALDVGATWQGFACFDIAIAGLRRGGLHAEGDNRPRLRCSGGLGQRCLQRCHIANRRIRGHEPKHSTRRGFLGEQRGGRDGGRAIAANGFQHDGCALVAQLLGDQEAMCFIANDHRRQEAGARTPRGGFRQHGLV